MDQKNQSKIAQKMSKYFLISESFMRVHSKIVIEINIVGVFGLKFFPPNILGINQEIEKLSQKGA